MGIFQQRPEEPTEWAGLPSEPWEPVFRVEQLAGAPDAASALIGEDPHLETIAITLVPATGSEVDSAGADGE
ncbi:hypothetical protein [Microbacterium invictum]|uniref:Uncharacterized protein n=1 Tax=Microbacterium invictum TaxID=515415 RepID=A0AA40SMC9_9MICO|nr:MULTISPECIES: hypothetical protein [Microbacterium]MBB4138807.1 hypothetical protein [Microbacterium invictum]